LTTKESGTRHICTRHRRSLPRSQIIIAINFYQACAPKKVTRASDWSVLPVLSD